MDDFNRRMMEQRRRQAREQTADAGRTEQDPGSDAGGTPPTEPAGAAELRMERRQGEWRYYLGEQRIRPGAAIEFYVDARIGWVHGTFQWGRRNVSVATIRVPVQHPDDGRAIGELEVTLPDGALCRVPE